MQPPKFYFENKHLNHTRYLFPTFWLKIKSYSCYSLFFQSFHSTNIFSIQMSILLTSPEHLPQRAIVTPPVLPSCEVALPHHKHLEAQFVRPIICMVGHDPFDVTLFQTQVTSNELPRHNLLCQPEVDSLIRCL